LHLDTETPAGQNTGAGSGQSVVVASCPVSAPTSLTAPTTTQRRHLSDEVVSSQIPIPSSIASPTGLTAPITTQRRHLSDEVVSSQIPTPSSVASPTGLTAPSTTQRRHLSDDVVSSQMQTPGSIASPTSLRRNLSDDSASRVRLIQVRLQPECIVCAN